MIPTTAISRRAVLAITRRGAHNAATLAGRWPKARLYILEPWHREIDAEVTAIRPPLRDHVKKLLEDHTVLVFFGALGAVVRLIAPHLRGKTEDPAVLAIDEKTRYVIPVISGHIGNANRHAVEVAKIFGAEAVITTASDVIGTLAVDLLGRESGWRIEAKPETLTRVAARVVNGQPVAIVQECGDHRWLETLPEPPVNLIRLDHIDQADPERHQGLLWITHRTDTRTIADRWPDSLILYRPPRGQNAPLSVGLGCDRGTSAATLENALEIALSGQHLRMNDIRFLATIEQKKDEKGLLELAEKLNRPLTFFSAERLSHVKTPNPSRTVWRHMGTPSVSEAAALLAAQGEMTDLLVEKFCFRGADGKNATVAIALAVSAMPGKDPAGR